MAHYVRLAPHRTKNRIGSGSRYGRSKVIYYGDENKLTYTLYKKVPHQFSPEDKWFEITEEYEYRPDKVCFEYFGTPDFWWRLMETNKMKDILEFKAGRKIRLPARILR